MSPSTPDYLLKINETFCCPLCQSNACWYVHYKTPAGRRVRMPWYSCTGCTLMFTDPHRFTVLMRRTQRPGTPGTDISPDQYGHVEEAPQAKGERPLLDWEYARLGPNADEAKD